LALGRVRAFGIQAFAVVKRVGFSFDSSLAVRLRDGI
jgi:hypothetical protein